MGDHRLIVTKTYDQAEAAEKGRDYARALEIYKRAVADDPADIEAHRRIGEVFLLMGKEDEALRELRAAYFQAADVEGKAALSFRVVDILAVNRRDIAGAQSMLREMVHGLAETRFAEAAQTRLDRLGLDN